jgi:hypothetical protein
LAVCRPHVVVQQRGGVDELDDRGGLDVQPAGVFAGPRGQQHRERPQALATRADDVLCDLVDQHDVAGEAVDDHLVEAAQFLRHRFPDLVELHSCAGPFQRRRMVPGGAGRGNGGIRLSA